MTRLRATLPSGARFDDVIQEQGVDWRTGPWQHLSIAPSPATPPLAPAVAPGSAPLVAPSVDAAAGVTDATSLRLLLALRTDRAWDESSATYQVERALFDGRVLDSGSYETVRRAALDARAAKARSLIDAWLADHPDLAAHVFDRGDSTPWLSVEVRPETLDALREDPAIAAIDLDDGAGEPEAQGRGWPIALQATDFHDSGYEGASSTSRVGLIEQALPWSGHPAFKPGATGTSRVTAFDCRTSLGQCPLNTSSSFEEEHPTGVAGLLLGDNTRDQHPEFIAGFRARYPGESLAQYEAAKVLAKQDRSGLARAAKLVAFGYGDSFKASRIGKAYDTMRAQSYAVPIVNLSFGLDADRSDGTPNPSCDPTTATSRHLNAYYEDGGLSFKSAGNDGRESKYTENGHPVPACTVTDPGAALSAIAVGSVEDAYTNATNPGIDRAASSAFSDPNGRAVVKLMAYKDLESPFRKYGVEGWDTRSYGTAPDDQEASGADPDDYNASTHWAGTSLSSPAVAGAAAVFRAWYLDTRSSFIDDPGMLAANLLHMGDRHQPGGAYLNTGFDDALGAGFLRLRRYESGYVPSPWGWGETKACVSTASIFRDVNLGNPIETDVASLDATLWWHDVDHDTGGALTNLDLHLWRLSTTGVWQLVRSSTSTKNNMERIHWEPSPTDNRRVYRWEIRPVGTVPAGHICGTGTRAFLVQTREGT
jgi:hypothetical protein